MKRNIFRQCSRVLSTFIFLLITLVLAAQDKIELDTEQVKSWFEENWMWVAAIVLIVVMIALFSRGRGGKRKTTTVIKDADGKTKSVTTTEETI